MPQGRAQWRSRAMRPAGHRGLPEEVLQSARWPLLPQRQAASKGDAKISGYRWSRSAIFEAFKRLEIAGVLGRIRRHKRAWVTIAGRLRETTVQMSSLYTFSRPHAAAHLTPRPRKVLTASERVSQLLNNLGRSVSMKEAGSKRRTGPQGNLLFPFKSGAACSGEGSFSVGLSIG